MIRPIRWYQKLLIQARLKKLPEECTLQQNIRSFVARFIIVFFLFMVAVLLSLVKRIYPESKMIVGDVAIFIAIAHVLLSIKRTLKVVAFRKKVREKLQNP